MNCYVHITSAVKNEGIDELRQHLMFKVVSEASLYPGETTDKHGKNMPSKNRKS